MADTPTPIESLEALQAHLHRVYGSLTPRFQPVGRHQLDHPHTKPRNSIRRVAQH